MNEWRKWKHGCGSLVQKKFWNRKIDFFVLSTSKITTKHAHRLSDVPVTNDTAFGVRVSLDSTRANTVSEKLTDDKKRGRGEGERRA